MKNKYTVTEDTCILIHGSSECWSQEVRAQQLRTAVCEIRTARPSCVKALSMAVGQTAAFNTNCRHDQCAVQKSGRLLVSLDSGASDGKSTEDSLKTEKFWTQYCNLQKDLSPKFLELRQLNEIIFLRFLSNTDKGGVLYTYKYISTSRRKGNQLNLRPSLQLNNNSMSVLKKSQDIVSIHNLNNTLNIRFLKLFIS